MNYIITGGTGFIGTHLTNLILAEHPDAKVWNLDIVKPGTPNPVVKNYKPAVREGETCGSLSVNCRSHRRQRMSSSTSLLCIGLLGMRTRSISRRISVEQRMYVHLQRNMVLSRWFLLHLLLRTGLLNN